MTPGVVTAESYASSFDDEPLERRPVNGTGEDVGALVKLSATCFPITLGLPNRGSLKGVHRKPKQVRGHLDGGRRLEQA